jgi:hypothetical protein
MDGEADQGCTFINTESNLAVKRLSASVKFEVKFEWEMMYQGRRKT